MYILSTPIKDNKNYRAMFGIIITIRITIETENVHNYEFID